jgi:AraC-like DNA-binding protein
VRPSQLDAAVLEAARFLAAHHAEELRLGDVADHVGYSPFHLARAFEARVGVPPGHYLAAQRFEAAKSLLLGGEDRVVDVCMAVGFRSLGTFTDRFSALVGVSPTVFRQLPDRLADHPPQPMQRRGPAPQGARVAGSLVLGAAATSVLGGAASLYVGLFPARAARGVPVSGQLLHEPGPFQLLGVPPGRYWLLASALDRRGDPLSQLQPAARVVGSAPGPLRLGPGELRCVGPVRLDLAPPWVPPVVVALPSLSLIPVATGPLVS